ncbi:MAG: HEAT repeat domain-containing protein [Candidatus Hodarchaeota archaeon]
MANNSSEKDRFEHFLKEIKSLSSYRRAEAVKRLGQMEELQITDLPLNVHSKLERALVDPEEEVRREAVMALAFLEGEVAIPLLEPLLNDPMLSVRSNAISAFSYIGKKPSSEVLKKMLSLLRDPSDEIRDRCVRALGRLKIEEATNDILRLAKSDSSPVVRAGAVAALGMMKNGDPVTLAKMIQELLISETSSLVISAINETLAIIKINSFDSLSL